MNGMKQHMGVWFPSFEQHMTEWMSKKNRLVDGKGTYQYHKLEKALTFVKQFRSAVDIGAHVGTWSMHLAKRFAALHAFEPISLHRKCFQRNLEGATAAVAVYPYACGNENRKVTMLTENGSSGNTKIVSGEGDTDLIRLDDMAILNVDFMKLDCEGYELFALQGAEQTILRDKPCIVVEQKHDFASKNYSIKDRAAIPWLVERGAVLRAEVSGDYILSWDDAPVQTDTGRDDVRARLVSQEFIVTSEPGGVPIEIVSGEESTQ
jgi:FkbM family methyltransferase